MDAVSVGRLKLLHPKLRDEAAELFAKADAALTGHAKPRIVFTYRTMREQQELYELGRSVRNPDGYIPNKRPLGDIVTNSKKGQSLHNYGLALDFALLIDGKSVSWNDLVDYDGDHLNDWMEVVKVFRDAGWEWGGLWKSIVDKPHLQKTFGHDWPELLQLFNAGKVDKQGYVIL